MRLYGFADRLEQDAEGRVVVVDFKTTKQVPREGDLPAHPQLGLYQLAVAHGAVDDLLDGGPARPGGAELVQLRKEVRGEAKVQRQDPQQPDETGRLPVEVQLGEAVRRLREEGFPAAQATTATTAASPRSARPRAPGRCCHDARSSTARRPARCPAPAALQAFMRAEYPLSDQQFAAVTAPLEPAVVIAGAGSGKTTLMAARVVWLVGTGQVRPEQVLGLTFTTKAAGELAARIRGALVRAGVLDRQRPVGGRGRGGARADGRDLQRLRRRAARRARPADRSRAGHPGDRRRLALPARRPGDRPALAPVAHLSDHPDTVINYLLGLDAQLSEHLVDPQQVLDLQDSLRPRIEEQLAAETRKTYRAPLEQMLFTFDRRVELLHLVREYRELKRGLGLMEFSDQIELGARLARTRPEVGRAERDKYAVVLLDEYQDTSVAQALMLSDLFSGPDAARGRGHAVMAVGDPNQAIYGWRGASVSNILRFGESFPRADGDTGVADLLADRQPALRPAHPRARQPAGRPLYDRFPMVAPLEAPAGAAEGEVDVEVFETYDDELAWLPDAVRPAHERFGSWQEIGVLTRDNKHAADVFRALSEAEIPVEIVGLKGLLELPEVAEVVATLTLLQDLTANAALLTLLTGPRWAVGPPRPGPAGAAGPELAGVGGPRRP